MIRRYGEAVKAGQRYRRRPGAYAILLRGDQMLTTFQELPKPEFQLPGGGIDPGEHPVAALNREVMEETGWTMRIRRRLGVFRRFCYMPDYDLWAEKLCSVWLAQPGVALGPPSEPGHSAVWMPVSEAAHLLGNPGDRAFVRMLVQGAYPPR